MSDSVRKLRAVVAVPLAEPLCELIENLEPRVELVRDSDLTPPMRWPADWSGEPAFQRTAEQQSAFDAMVDSADALFGIPDVSPAALARTVAVNPRLKWVMATAAGGGGQIKEANLECADLERIVFTTTAGVHGEPLAEFALLGVLAGAKNLPRLRRDQESRHWGGRWEMRHLDQMTVLVLGLGGIGRVCAQRFSQLGSRVWGTTRDHRPVDGVERLLTLEELVGVMPEVDALVVTLPGTDVTRHLVSTAMLSAARPGLVIVNVGRGTVVDEAALVAALSDGTVGFAALDVAEHEPLAPSSPLWAHPKVLISPHTAGLDSREEERIARHFARTATLLLDGEPLGRTVDTTDFY